MKKSDLLTPIGLIGGIILIIWGMKNDAGYGMFWDLPSVLITVGGSVASLLITVRTEDMKKLINLTDLFFSSSEISL